MFRTYGFRLVNSFELLGIIILLASVLTSVFLPEKTEPDPSIMQQSLTYSHLLSAQVPPSLPRHIK